MNATTSEWCTEKLSQLLNEELRISTLNEIKEHLTSISTNEANRTAHLLELPLVFDCLNDSNSEQVDLACEVLSLCMTNLNIGESTNRYSIPLERALNHPYTNVKIMALNELARYTVDDDSITNLCHQKNLLHSTVTCISDQELSVASRAMKIIVQTGQSDVCIKYLLSKDTLQIIEDAMRQSEVIRLRFYEVFIDIGKTSEGHLNILLSSGVLTKFVEELNGNDVLVLMNILVLLSNLVVCNHGYKFLEKQQVLDRIFKNDDPIFESSCGSGTARLFGNLAHWKPTEMLAKYESMTEKLFSNLSETDHTVVGIALDTIAYIGESNDGKIALNSLGNKMNRAIECMKIGLKSFPTPMRVRTLNTIESLLKTTTPTEAVEGIAKGWFKLLDDEPMDFILKFAKTPFGEIRVAGLGVIYGISNQIWGQQLIKSTPGLVEFLMDRSSETIKECKQVKYEIVTNLLSALTVFDKNMTNKFQTFVREGPYYVQAVMEVAVEGNE